MSDSTINRRGALKALAVVGTAAAGLKAVSKAQASSGAEAEGAHRWALVIDQARCTGCNYCVNTCQAHNDIHPDIRWNRVLEQSNHGGKPVYLSRPCMHCEHPPCKEVCMVGATYIRDDGIVMMDYDKCIGCRYCEVACPYYARAFNWEAFTGDNPYVPEWGQPEVKRRPRGVVEKCGFCYQRIDRGLAMGLIPGVDEEASPACVAACPVGARIFGDLNDPESRVSQLIDSEPYCQLRDDLGTGPRVYYLSPGRESA